MGMSQPPDVPVDLVASYARRRGDSVEIVIGDPTFRDPAFLTADAPVVAVLRSDRRRVRVPATIVDDARGRRLVISCPRTRLGRGTWTITLRADGRRQRVDARLLVQGQRPLVLLWGAKGSDSRPAVPYAERHPVGLPGRIARRVRHAAGRIRR